LENLKDLDEMIELWLLDRDELIGNILAKTLLQQPIGDTLLPHLPFHGAYLSIISRDIPELFQLFPLPASLHHGLMLTMVAHSIEKPRSASQLIEHYGRDKLGSCLDELAETLRTPYKDSPPP
jgi:hypothetical protein